MGIIDDIAQKGMTPRNIVIVLLIAAGIWGMTEYQRVVIEAGTLRALFAQAGVEAHDNYMNSAVAFENMGGYDSKSRAYSARFRVEGTAKLLDAIIKNKSASPEKKAACARIKATLDRYGILATGQASDVDYAGAQEIMKAFQDFSQLVNSSMDGRRTQSN